MILTVSKKYADQAMAFNGSMNGLCTGPWAGLTVLPMTVLPSPEAGRTP